MPPPATKALRIREGFPGQRSVVLPRAVVSRWLASEPLFDLLPSDVGYFPTAQGHYVDRPRGSPQLILIYCFAGEGWARINDERLTIRPGQLLVVPPNTPHLYGSDPDSPWTIYWVHMAGLKMDTFYRLLELDAQSHTLFPGLDPALPPLFERIIQTLNSGYSAGTLHATSTILHQMATHLIAARHNLQSGEDGHEVKIKFVIDFMNRSLDRNLTLDALAQRANMSTSHFAFIFKKRTGFPPLDYFMRLKMQRACFLLDTTTLPVKAIAAQLGFDDPLYFSRRFRHVHNCSPMQYQAIQKG